MNDAPNGEIYCKADYAAKFGLKGYGFGQGAGTLMSVSSHIYHIPENASVNMLSITSPFSFMIKEQFDFFPGWAASKWR